MDDMWKIVLFLLALVVISRLACAANRPNIILILADDMGFSDIGCFGSEIDTPNIDRLATQGIRMTQFYNCARCCPTRASLMTGLYPHQTGVGHMMEDRGPEGYRGQLNDHCVTMAEALGAAGYHTALAGKWHLCNAVITGKPQVNHQNRDPFWTNASKAGWPRQRGFDSFYGIVIGVADYFDAFTLTRDNAPVFDPPPQDFYLTDAITEEAVAQIKAIGDRPLFMYVAYTAPHWPLQARPEDIAKYRDRYQAGYAALRESRHQRQVKLGIVDSAWKMPEPEPEVRSAEPANADKMAVYAAQIDRLDQGVGKILAALDAIQQADNTLVLFLSDNGGCAEIPKPEWFDVTTQTRDGQPIGPDQMPLGSPRSYASYGPGWAWASNTPFRRYKHWVHEGGISTPLIARWPAQIKPHAAPIGDVAHVIDLMPTFLAVAGASYPTRYHDHDITPAEGVSLLSCWKDEEPPGSSPRTLFWEHEGNRAVRSGDWKLVAGAWNKPWELYNMVIDRTETRNVALVQREKVKELSDAYQAWAKRVGVVPPNELPKLKK